MAALTVIFSGILLSDSELSPRDWLSFSGGQMLLEGNEEPNLPNEGGKTLLASKPRGSTGTYLDENGDNGEVCGVEVKGGEGVRGRRSLVSETCLFRIRGLLDLS